MLSIMLYYPESIFRMLSRLPTRRSIRRWFKAMEERYSRRLHDELVEEFRHVVGLPIAYKRRLALLLLTSLAVLIIGVELLIFSYCQYSFIMVVLNYKVHMYIQFMPAGSKIDLLHF
jgi:hypothetical protein